MSGLEQFLNENNLRLVRQLSKGWTSYVYLAENFRGEKFALKVLREKSNRSQMASREAENLKIANSVGVGPKFVYLGPEKKIVMMEFIEGVPFSEWLESTQSKQEMQKFIDALLAQARALDNARLDHGQLAGRGRNILVRNGLPVIIDFEKASSKRKVHNVKVLESFLFRSKDSGVVKKIKRILGEDAQKFGDS